MHRVYMLAALVIRGCDSTTPAVDIHDEVVDLLGADMDMEDEETQAYIDSLVQYALDNLPDPPNHN